ncbi:MAG: hypothetical protein LBC40_04080 [Dysgonamonadaceae bacterium]|jgi:hypothetical protein|nr:hypothetical protein [Dysgonamonadaceae bacterium]
MHIGKGSAGTPALYVPGNQLLADSSAVVLGGIQHLDGHLVGNHLYADAHGFDPAASFGKLLMKGSRRQQITTGGLPYDRTRNYLSKVPVLEINNPAGVHLSDSIALSVDTLSLVKGKLILGSSYVNDAETRLAHFLVRDSVKYNRADTAVVEVEMVIGHLGIGRERKFMGFSPPFKRMYADYFVYNYLLVPDETGLFGASGHTGTYPGFALEAGRGYIVGQNVYDFTGYDDYWLIPAWNLTPESYYDRMRDTLRLNRYALKGIRIVDVSGYPITQADAYTGESLNTGDVTVPLKQGYNYLGNPYTCPLDLSKLKQAGSADEWGVSRDIADPSTADIYAGYWVMHSGQRTSHSVADKTFSISVSYDINQAVGSTGTTDSIPPMQLFLLYANRDCSLKIPASARTHGKAHFLKSGGIVTDELLLEVRDQTTEGFDRMCVVFRNHATTSATDAYDAYKVVNTSKGVSQVYTTSPEGVDLITSVISSTEESLAVTLLPSAVDQEVELTASRLETLTSPEAVQLEDLKTGDIVDLTTESYRFTTAPGDDPHRFILHFKDVLGASTGAYAVETPHGRSLPGIAYAANEITIGGLQKEDAGSTITVSDVQGRILLKERFSQAVAESGTVGYSLPLSPGIYVASLSGSRSITIKFTGR